MPKATLVPDLRRVAAEDDGTKAAVIMVAQGLKKKCIAFSTTSGAPIDSNICCCRESKESCLWAFLRAYSELFHDTPLPLASSETALYKSGPLTSLGVKWVTAGSKQRITGARRLDC